MKREPCSVCTRLVATAADWQSMKHGEGKELCWSPDDALCRSLRDDGLRERASRACHNCVHFDQHESVIGCHVWKGNVGVTVVLPGALRQLLRTAASCDDYEEVDDSEEGVEA